jgi:hypothetical protein
MTEYQMSRADPNSPIGNVGATIIKGGYKIKGENPDINQVKAEFGKYGNLGKVADQYIMCRESHYNQLKDNGMPTFGGKNGWGVMQLDPPYSTDQLWHWKKNIVERVSRLKIKEDDAKRWLKQHPYTADQLLTETVARYNGGNYYKESYILNDDGTVDIIWTRRDITCNSCMPNVWNSGVDNDNDSKCIIVGVCYFDLGCH